jgi:type I restriction enzyme S subunit
MRSTEIRGSLDRISETALQETSIRAIDPPAILLVVRGMILARRVPIALTCVRVTINQDMKAILPLPGTDARFLLYAMEASKDSFAVLIDEAGHGTKRLPTERWRELSISFPPSDEQAAIARFLDHADLKIRRFSQAKRRLIELLNEQKRTIVNRVVTRGLDSNAPFKPSGTTWLDEIPEHWEMVPFGRLLSFGPKNGVSPPPASQNHPGVTSFSIAAIRDGRVQVRGHEKLVSLQQDLIPQFRVTPGDVLLVRGNGNLDYVARCGLVTECSDDTVYPDIVIKVRPNERMAPDFMVYAVNSRYVRNQVACVAKTTNGTFKISGGTLSGLRLAVPPFDEQKRILGWVDSSSASLDHATQAALRHIDLIREYRTRLIADVVTGKLDVREAAERLPSSAEQAAPDDESLGLSALDPEEADGLDDDPELLPVTADEE